MARRRERVVWYPEWTDEYKKWSEGFINRNKWRCDKIHDADDLMQEAYLTFAYVASTYPRIIDPQYFLALFKRAMINKMHDRSCRVKRRRGTVEAPISADLCQAAVGRIGEMANAGYMVAMLNEAPEEMKLALAMTANPSTKLLKDMKKWLFS